VATGGGPGGVPAMSPDGRSLYIAVGAPLSQVSQFNVGSGGLLSPKTPATVATGGSPNWVVITPLPRIPTSKDQCKNGAWRNFPQFKNEGQCIAFVNRS
jgi:hypothetical protein